MNMMYFSRRAFAVLCLFAALACAAVFSPKGSGQVKGGGFDREVSRSLSRYDRLSLDPADAERLVRQTGRLTLETSAGNFGLLLEPNDVRAENYRAVEVLEGGETRELPREPSHTFKGAVDGDGGSVARFTLDGRTIEGMIIKGGKKFFVESAARYTREAAPSDLLFYRESEVIADPVSCAVDTLSSKVNEQVSRTQASGTNESVALAVPVSPAREAQLATEADNEYVAAAGGAAAANNEILSTVNLVNGIYQNEIGLTFKVVFQRAWDTQDPFNATTLSGLLTELRNAWTTNSPPVPVEGRDLVHLWTGRDLDGNQTGLAFDNVTINNVNQRGVVCVAIPANPTTGRPAQTFSFGVSERQLSGVARVVVPAHEMGHNFSAHHPEDVGHGECGLTIMSGTTQDNTNVTFCQFSRDEITGYINFTLNPTNTFTTPCLDVAPAPPPPTPTPTPTPTPVQTPSVQFSTNDYRVTEGTPSVLITVTRSSGDGASSVQYQTTNGTGTNPASERSDYTTAVGTMRFNPGETSKSFSVLITNDAYGEGPETFQVQLVNPSNASLGSPSTANVTITSDETANGANPVRPQTFNADFFVRQHYADFLNREPDQSGLQFWIGQTTNCGSPDPQVCRVNVSAAFFLSIEFQETGFYAIRVQRVAFGRRSDTPSTLIQDQGRMNYREVIEAQRTIGEGVVVNAPGFEKVLEANKNAYAAQIVADPRFSARFSPTLPADAFVDTLFSTAGVTPTSTERQNAISAYNNAGGGAAGRAAALRSAADSGSVRSAELNTAFVLLEYHGYMRRNPTDAPDTSDAGYQFWLGKLNGAGGNYIQAEMVNSFITSIEYIQRFGP
jgi:hypothetical protein